MTICGMRSVAGLQMLAVLLLAWIPIPPCGLGLWVWLCPIAAKAAAVDHVQQLSWWAGSRCQRRLSAPVQTVLTSWDAPRHRSCTGLWLNVVAWGGGSSQVHDMQALPTIAILHAGMFLIPQCG